jgi:hypothetical protein
VNEEDNKHNIVNNDIKNPNKDTDDLNDLIRIGENYLTQGNNGKSEDPHSTQHSTQDIASRQDDPVEAVQNESDSEYEQSQETSTNDTPVKEISLQIEEYNE